MNDKGYKSMEEDLISKFCTGNSEIDVRIKEWLKWDKVNFFIEIFICLICTQPYYSQQPTLLLFYEIIRITGLKSVILSSIDVDIFCI